MAAIALSADGQYIFVAAEYAASGNQVVLKAAIADLSVWVTVYAPGAGSAANVLAVPGNPDKMLFYGNFDTDVVLVEHTISTGVNADISPASLGADVANAAAVNPSNPSEIIIVMSTAEDIKYTADGGATWADWDTTLALDATALAALWSGAYDLHRYFTAGVQITYAELVYSPNQGASDYDYTGSMEVANVTNLEATEQKVV